VTSEELQCRLGTLADEVRALTAALDECDHARQGSEQRCRTALALVEHARVVASALRTALEVVVDCPRCVDCRQMANDVLEVVDEEKSNAEGK